MARRFSTVRHVSGRAREPVAGDGGGGGGGGGGSGPPDTYVTDWDVVGTQAVTAGALTGAEGYTIFAYVAIAVYDSVMAIEDGYALDVIDADLPGTHNATHKNAGDDVGNRALRPSLRHS